ncbi:MAG: BACON domain-containing protein, partial [Tidjanibacter sp.]|nr:BACON domain-containing protein [Tidjanibacter sp.]
AEYVSHEVNTTPRIVKVTPSSLSFSAEGGSNTITVTTAGEGGTLAATSDADWATVSVADNVVTVATSAHEGEEVRSATITITYGDTSATVTIEQAAPLAEGAEAWVMVTDASTLAAGDQVVIVATDSNAAMSTNQKSNNRGQATITKSANTVTINNEVQIFTLEAGTVANTWAFKAGDTGYLFASSSSSNHLKTGSLNDHASWSIEIDGSGVATVKSQGGASRNWMRHNESSSLFACYASGQKDIAIYKLTK